MLHQITWGQFWVFIIVVTGGYYLFVVVRFYGGRLKQVFTRRTGGGDVALTDKTERADGDISNRSSGTTGGSGGSPVKAEEGESIRQTGERTKAGNQNDRKGSARTDAQENSEGDAELFTMLQQAMTTIRKVIEQALHHGLDQENTIDHIREVLRQYRKLRGSEYQETVNNYIIRVCAAELSVELSGEQVAGLWK